MDGQLILVICVIAVALVFDFLNGFHDAANSIATVVSTRVLSPRAAVLLAACCNFSAAFLLETKVASTIGHDIVHAQFVDPYLVMFGLLGAIVWNLITWWLGLPSSSSHALIGKDPTRIDRIAAYAARYAAKNVVAAQLAEECEIQLSYSIGLSRPVSIQVETFGTGIVPDDDLKLLVERHFDFRMAGILRQFNLRHLPAKAKGSFYQRLAAYGHFGREDLELPWEDTDKAQLLRDVARRP